MKRLKKMFHVIASEERAKQSPSHRLLHPGVPGFAMTKTLPLALFFAVVFLILSTLPSFSQKNMQFRDNLTYPKRLSDIWGYADSLGNEYALVGVLNGVSIVNVTDPDSIYELFFIPGAESIWRDIKTWNKHAYITNETSGGLLIIDLEKLPDSIQTSSWTADTALNIAHNIYIDENGFAYIFGFNNLPKNLPGGERGALIADLKPDPKNPVFAGHYKTAYVHDAYVRGDTMWTSEIHDGRFAVVDVSDKSNPMVLAVRGTSGHATHNSWLSDDGKTLFTTDETANGPVSSFDVSNLNNINETDLFYAAPNSGLIPHNTHVINNYLVTSYYKYGVNIVDATLPNNLVEVGYYDTSPFLTGDGYNGCWGAYPFLPSGNILATDIETGLFVFTPTYVRASYLEGKITQENNGASVIDAFVEIMTTGILSSSNITGDYKTGVAVQGLYDIRINKFGCLPKIIPGVNMQSGIVTTLNVALNCTTTTGIIDAYGRDKIELFASPSLFSNSTSIYFNLPEQSAKGNSRLNIYDISGKELFTLPLDITEGEVEWGTGHPAGAYIVRIIGSDETKSLKVLKDR